MILATALLMLTSFAANPCQSAAAAETADALAAKFDDHQFVFIGSTHGDLKIINARCAHDFRVGPVVSRTPERLPCPARPLTRVELSGFQYRSAEGGD